MKGRNDDQKTRWPQISAKAAAQTKGKARAAARRSRQVGERDRAAADLTASPAKETQGALEAEGKPLVARSLAAAVMAALRRGADESPPANPSKLDLVADALVAKACAGDVTAI